MAKDEAAKPKNREEVVQNHKGRRAGAKIRVGWIRLEKSFICTRKRLKSTEWSAKAFRCIHNHALTESEMCESQ